MCRQARNEDIPAHATCTTGSKLLAGALGGGGGVIAVGTARGRGGGGRSGAGARGRSGRIGMGGARRAGGRRVVDWHAEFGRGDEASWVRVQSHLY